MAEHPVSANVLGLTAQIVSAHVSNNSVSPDASAFADTGSLQDACRRRQGTGGARPAAARGAGQEVGVSRPHHLSGGRQETEDAQAASEDRLRHDAGAVSRALGPAAGIPDGGAELRAPPFFAGQEDRPRHQAARRPEIIGPKSPVCRPRLVSSRDWTEGARIGYAAVARIRYRCAAWMTGGLDRKGSDGIAHRAPVRRTWAEDDRPAPCHRPRAVRCRRSSGRGGTVPPGQRAGSAHLDRHRLPHGAAAGGEGHPGAPRFRRRPGALRAHRARPPLPSDRHRNRQGDRVRGRRASADDAGDRRAAGLRPRLVAAGTVRPQARDPGGARAGGQGQKG